MGVRPLGRPATRLALPARIASSHHGLVARRSHQTAARTKRSLSIPPAPYFLPDSSAGSHILVTPAPSTPSPYNTPLKFLPKNDPKRRAYLISRFQQAAAAASAPAPPSPITRIGETAATTRLPPLARKVKRKEFTPVTEEAVAEMRKLRQEDPAAWSIGKLAERYNVNRGLVSIATGGAPREHLDRLDAKLERAKARWGPRRTKARDDRRKRHELLERGEL